jgi:hypothetical protein
LLFAGHRHPFIGNLTMPFEEFSSSNGSYKGQLNIDAGGAGNDMTLDTNGNFWVMNNGANRVEEYNSSGTWLQSIGGTSAACTSCGCTTSYAACPTAAGDGQATKLYDRTKERLTQDEVERIRL